MRPLLLLLRSLLCSLLLFPSTVLVAQVSKPITEHGLEQSLRLGGLKEAELIAQINRRGVDFFLNSENERQLQQVGASPAVLQAIRSHYKGPDHTIVTGPPPATPATPVAAAAIPAVSQPVRSNSPQAPGIYVQRAGVWTLLHQESAMYTSEKVSRVFGKASAGLIKLKGDVTGGIAGEHSGVAVPSPATFLIRMPGGMSATDYLLVHTHARHDNREFKISAEALHSKDSVDYRILTVNGSALQIEVSQGAGDYAFVDTRSQPSVEEGEQKVFLYTFQIGP